MTQTVSDWPKCTPTNGGITNATTMTINRTTKCSSASLLSTILSEKCHLQLHRKFSHFLPHSMCNYVKGESSNTYRHNEIHGHKGGLNNNAVK